MNLVTRKKNFGVSQLLNVDVGDHITVICETNMEMQSVVQTCYNVKTRNDVGKHFSCRKDFDNKFVEIQVESR